MVGHGGSSAGSYLADPTSPIPSHCASIVVTSTLRVKSFGVFLKGELYFMVFMYHLLLRLPLTNTMIIAVTCKAHSTKKPVTTMLTYPWKCTVLHCNHLGNTWKPLVLMTRHFDYCPSASDCDNQSVRVISTSGFQVFPRWLQCKNVHFQG